MREKIFKGERKMSFAGKGIRITAFVLSLIMVLAVFAGCQKTPPASVTPTPTGSETAGDSKDDTTKPSSLASDKPIEISVFLVDRPDMPWSEDMPVIQELGKRTNVYWKMELAPISNAAERYNIMMASSELPDVVNYQFVDIMMYAEKGAFEPLDELIEQYAPNLKSVLDEDPSYRKTLKGNDGKIYVVPNVGAIKVSEVFYLRQDWLDKLGLDTPKTIDDWYEMLKAFKERDPNGNGEKDEIPYSVRNKRNNLMVFGYAWGLQDDEFFIEDGKVKYGAADPRMKELITWLAKLYSEGLIDPNYLTNDAKLWEANFVNGKSGATHDWISRINSFNANVGKVDPSADFRAVLPPVGPAGKPMTRHQQEKLRIDSASAAIASTSKYKVEIMKMFDYMFSEEGNLLMNFGIEGVHYKMENGYPKYTDIIMNDPDGRAPNVMTGVFGISRDIPLKKDIRYEEQVVLLPASAEAVKMYEPVIVPPYPKLKFTDDEQEVLNAKYTEIKTYVDEMLDKFITGYEPIDKFDAFVKKLYDIGLEDVIKIHEDALARYNAN